MCIYDDAFARTDKTDAILVVQGKKMHVNKALLSYHSDYFNTLFNSMYFKEKSMEEIPIDDVIFEDFAILLSIFHKSPFPITKSNTEGLLKLADRFLLENPKCHVERFIIDTNNFTRMEMLKLADTYKLEKLLEHALGQYTTDFAYQDMRTDAARHLSAEVKARLFDDFFVNFY